MKGEGEAAWKICEELSGRGFLTEPVVKLQLAAAAKSPEAVPEQWRTPTIQPEDCLPGLVYLEMDRKESADAQELLLKYRAVHPERNTSQWLTPSFWLDPVRNWIA